MILEQALKGVMKIGFIPESVFDVLEEMPQMRSYVESRPDLPELGSKRKLKGFVSLNYALESKKVEAMKRALLEYQVPLVVASYDYFAVGHAYVVYGWDDSWVHKKARRGTQIFAFRNSWGEDYEDGGNSTIPVTYIDQVYLPIFEDMPMPFEDVFESDWFYDEVRAAAFSGLMQGTTEKTFEPYDSLIRGDLALVIQRALSNMASLSNAFMKTMRQMGKTGSEIKLFGARDCKEKFMDVKGDAYYNDAILMICANGIMHGTGENLFEPQKAVARCELAATLVRVYHLCVQLLQIAVPEAAIAKPCGECSRYDDVQEDDWFFKDVVSAGCLGLMHGDGYRKFYPEDPINRAEAATSLNRLFRLIDKALQAVSEVGGGAV